MKYLGMQILVEGLAMAAFGLMEKFANEPLLKQMTQYIMRDESRHVAFGVLSLETYYKDLNEREMREREEFCYEGCRLMRDRLYAEAVWHEMGLPIEETREIVMHSDDHARVPEDAVLEGRAEREAPGASHAVAARAVPRARHPEVRARRAERLIASILPRLVA